MHEYGIAKEVLRVIEAHLASYENSKPISCTLKVGALSGINPEALEAAIPMAVKGTVAEGVEFKVSVDPVSCKCRNCGANIELDEFVDMLVCESCGSQDIECPEDASKVLIQGLELEKDGRRLVVEMEGAEVEEEEHGHEH